MAQGNMMIGGRVGKGGWMKDCCFANGREGNKPGWRNVSKVKQTCKKPTAKAEKTKSW